ncbi:DUF2242 domain-containing protein [Acidovorax sp.]|uniref:DUF2242 domain-containing protein n=1 Tax=Acidovorax sp. TaxID=1872122 RepID=UPI002ACEBCFC|nr:DUF2242 domain-containing protein [Acidovorax sp.]MDZ7863295.1 DUF2242 domain-containing protein [Acidovorax sp.]
MPSKPSALVPFGATPRALRPLAALLAGVALLLAGCGTLPSSAQGPQAPQEKFGSLATYSRLFDATPAQTCEASRRALLSQGYIINTSSAELVEGKKNFQPGTETHMQMVIRVVCVPESPTGKISLGFVTAIQDSFALRKTNNSASLGVGAIGSVSLPFSSSSESLVRVGSETITTDTFYESFFDLVKRYLVIDEAAQANE